MFWLKKENFWKFRKLYLRFSVFIHINPSNKSVLSWIYDYDLKNGPFGLPLLLKNYMFVLDFSWKLFLFYCIRTIKCSHYKNISLVCQCLLLLFKYYLLYSNLIQIYQYDTFLESYELLDQGYNHETLKPIVIWIPHSTKLLKR